MWIPKTRQAGIKRREQNNRVSVKAAAAVAAAAGLPIASHKGRPGMANTFSSEANAVEMMTRVAMDKKGIGDDATARQSPNFHLCINYFLEISSLRSILR